MVEPPGLLACPGPMAPDAAASSAAIEQDTTSTRAAASLEDILPTLVRRIGWSGDRHRGTVRIELGASELAGGTLLVHAEGGRVRVHLDAPPGVDIRQWQQRICDRLAKRGVSTDSVEVT